MLYSFSVANVFTVSYIIAKCVGEISAHSWAITPKELPVNTTKESHTIGLLSIQTD